MYVEGLGLIQLSELASAAKFYRARVGFKVRGVRLAARVEGQVEAASWQQEAHYKQHLYSRSYTTPKPFSLNPELDARLTAEPFSNAVNGASSLNKNVDTCSTHFCAIAL